MMITCAECGREVSDQSYVCPRCGRDVRVLRATVAVAATVMRNGRATKSGAPAATIACTIPNWTTIDNEKKYTTPFVKARGVSLLCR